MSLDLSMTENDIDLWADLRYDYYLAGRTLLFNNQLQSAMLMLGYAVEGHLKHLMAANDLLRGLASKGHNFFGYVAALRDAGYLQDVHLGDDLLHFIEYNFHRRYPRQTKETIQKANERGHAVSMSPTVMVPYDDLLIQLDQSVTSFFGTPHASVLLKAVQRIEDHGANYFFHCNYPAIAKLDGAIGLAEEWLELLRNREPHLYDINLSEHHRRLAVLRDRERLIKSSSVEMVITPAGGFEGALKAAENFRYPGKFSELPDGTRISTSSY